MIAFRSCLNIKVFEKTYKNFRTEKDYDSRCFNIRKKNLINFQKFRETLAQFVSEFECFFMLAEEAVMFTCAI